MQPASRTGGNHPANKAAAQNAFWTLAWLVTLALARLGPMYLWDSQAASWVAVIANVAVGIGWIVAHARFVREADELQRKIMLDAIGVTLGAGLVLGFAYGSADVAGLLARTLNIALFPVFLAFVYIIAIVIGNLRYR